MWAKITSKNIVFKKVHDSAVLLLAKTFRKQTTQMKNYTLINVSVTNRYIASSVDLASVSIAVNMYLAPLLLVYLHLSIIVHTDVHATHALCANDHLASMPDVKGNGSVADRGNIASARAVENVRAVRYVVCREVFVDVDSVAMQNLSIEMLFDELA